jgi:hypothetical protein
MSVLHSINAREIRDDEIEDFKIENELQPGSKPRSAIDRHPVRAFAFLTCLYFVAVFGLSSLKLLWLDELITLHIARLSGPAAIWQALWRGADPNPPLSHLLVHYSRLLFGEHEVALRMPAMIGYWLGMLALFIYLKRRVPGTWAVVGTVWLLTMGAFEYSYESRSYGIFFGLAMLAFLFWTRAVGPFRSQKRRFGALAGLCIALAAGISTNYFAVLAFLPVSMGECVRSAVLFARKRRFGDKRSTPTLLFRDVVDYPVWTAIMLAGLPLLAYRPLIEHSIAQFAPYAWNKVSLGQVADSYTEMVEVALYPILALFILAGVVYLLRRKSLRFRRKWKVSVVPSWSAPIFEKPLPRVTVPWHEYAAIFAFMTYPILGYLIASVRGGMLSPRFVIPVCFGFAIAATLISYHLFGNFSRAGIGILCFVTCWFICREAYVGYWYEEQKECFYKVIDRLPRADAFVPANAPIVIPDPLLALTFRHYAPQQYASREVFPLDFPAIRFYRHDDSAEENIWAGRGFLYRLPIIPIANFESSAGKYLIIASDGNWFLHDLHDHRFDADRLSIDTRAEAIGGFTPLAHGTPTFYVSDGPLTHGGDGDQPLPFHSADNLPTGRALVQIGAS